MVTDKSKTSGIAVQQFGKSRITVVTTAAFTGSKQVDVVLKPGRWTSFARQQADKEQLVPRNVN